MELMSSLLFCAFVTILPQALGKEIFFRRTLDNFPVLSKPTYTMRNKLLIKSNTSPILKRHDSLLFSVQECSKCLYCMSQAVKENERKYNMPWRIINENDKGKRQTYNHFGVRSGKESRIGYWSFNRTRLLLYKDKAHINNFLTVSPPRKHFGVRIKRRSIPVTTTEKIKMKEEKRKEKKEEKKEAKKEEKKDENKVGKKEENKENKKTEKKEEKKKKDHKQEKKREEKKGYKFASVVKYKTNGTTYALKINETKFDTNKGVQSGCYIYKVINTYQCGSKEESFLLADQKNKKSLKNKPKGTTTQKALHKKEVKGVDTHREEAPSGSILETSFLPSIEETY